MVFRREIGAILILCVLGTVAWCTYYARWPGTPDFRIPTCYKGDALLTMGVVKGFSEMPPLWNIEAHRLGAPYTANWNDYPLSEKLVYYPLGFLARYVDPGVGANLDLLLAHLFSALGFYVAARYFGAGRVIAVGFSLFYGFSSYIFMRGLSHLILSYCGQIPLMLVVLDQAMKTRVERRRWASWLAAFVVVLAGLMSPYYWFFCLGLAAIAGAIWLARGFPREAAFGLFTAFGLLAAFLVGQSGYYLTAFRQGPNPEALQRSLNALVEGGLRLPGLIWPAAHVIKPWADFAQRHYFSHAGALSEGSTPFLGIVGVLALILMTGVCLKRAAQGRWHEIPTEAWAALFAIAFAVIGGIDYLLGSFGFVMLRSVNRYSVIVLASALIFMAARLLPRLPRWTGYGLLIVLLCLSGWEVSGLRKAFRPEWGWYRRMEMSDRVFAKMLDQELPEGAMVFTMPVWIFPEAPPSYRMGDYDHFRSYIWSDHIRLSYGSDRGRHREDWQNEAVAQPVPEMVRRLEKAGFSAILIERKAYEDNAAKLEASLRQAGLSVLADSPDRELVAYRLHPAAAPELPVPEKPDLRLGGDFYGWEEGMVDGQPSRWSWSSGSAKIRLLSTPTPAHPSLLLTFKLSTLRQRHMRIEIDGEKVADFDLPDGGRRSITLQWTPKGERTIVFLRTDRRAGKGSVPTDPRLIAFGVFDPKAVMAAGPALETPRAIIAEVPLKK